jgi:hypothetical protein
LSLAEAVLLLVVLVLAVLVGVVTVPLLPLVTGGFIPLAVVAVVAVCVPVVVPVCVTAAAALSGADTAAVRAGTSPGSLRLTGRAAMAVVCVAAACVDAGCARASWLVVTAAGEPAVCASACKSSDREAKGRTCWAGVDASRSDNGTISVDPGCPDDARGEDGSWWMDMFISR